MATIKEQFSQKPKQKTDFDRIRDGLKPMVNKFRDIELDKRFKKDSPLGRKEKI